MCETNLNNKQYQQKLIVKCISALQELVLCKRRHVREQCGESAAIFMRDHLPRITNPVLEQHCSAYTYGPGTCDEALYRSRFSDGHLVAQSTYHNPFDHGSSASSSSQHFGGHGNNRFIRNQNGESSSSSSSSSLLLSLKRDQSYHYWKPLLMLLLITIIHYIH